MSDKELKEFVKEIITHQITDTIDKEEKWQFERNVRFFGEGFEIITEIQKKYENELIHQDNLEEQQKDRQEYQKKQLRKGKRYVG